jgi:hypothetical protein
MAVEPVCAIAGLVRAEPRSRLNVNVNVLRFILIMIALSGSDGCS